MILKYLLTKRKSKPVMSDRSIFDRVISLCARPVLYMGIGNLYFLFSLKIDSWSNLIPCFLIIGLALLNMLNPYEMFTRIGAKLCSILDSKFLRMKEPCVKPRTIKVKQQKPIKYIPSQKHIKEYDENRIRYLESYQAGSRVKHLL